LICHRGWQVSWQKKTLVNDRAKRLWAFCAELGWWNAWLYLCGLVLRRCSSRAQLHKYYLVAQPVPAQPLLPQRRRTAITINVVSQAEYDPAWFPRPLEAILARFEQGAVCFVAFKAQEAIGCLWLLPGPYLEDEVRCRFIPSPPGQAAWDFDVYLQPAYRSGRTFAYLWDHANGWLRERGIGWTMSRIDAFNRASLDAHRRLGAQRVGALLFVGVGKSQMLLADVRPYVHLSRNARRCPEIVVSAPL